MSGNELNWTRIALALALWRSITNGLASTRTEQILLVWRLRASGKCTPFRHVHSVPGLPIREVDVVVYCVTQAFAVRS